MSRSLIQRIVACVCVVAAAGFTPGASVAGDDAAAGSPVHATALQDLAGRWQGRFHAFGARRASCQGDDCHALTLDIGRCGDGWCGVIVGKDGGCGATALKLASGKPDGREYAFEGTISIAEGTEPYTVRATGNRRSADDPAVLWLIGDTGGTLRMMRRTFPFEAQLTRQGEPACKEQKTS